MRQIKKKRDDKMHRMLNEAFVFELESGEKKKLALILGHTKPKGER